MKRRIWFQNGVNAYLTVEAAMVLLIVLSVMVFIIYAMFFQYNRCLLDQDTGALALRGAAMQIDDKVLLAEEVKEQANYINRKKYLMWEMGEMNCRLKGNQLCLMWEGELKYPIGIWKTRSVYKNDMVNPTSFVRKCRKLAGGK